MMPDFDFITNSDFRESLERDYRELTGALGAGAWKSVQVLAGSIIEAVLVDYLLAIPNPSRVATDPLRMDFAGVIGICHSEGVLTQRTNDLCSVIRSYRNLIHPTRAIRLKEEPPSEDSASIAVALINLIVTDVVRYREKTFGFTANQILLKIERDPKCLPFLGDLLENVQQSEQDKLLLQVFPKRYAELSQQTPEASSSSMLVTLRRAYITVKGVASEGALKKAALDYVRVLKEGSGELVAQYDEAFFRATDIANVPKEEQLLVKNHLLSTIGFIDAEQLARIRGIEKYLEVKDVSEWLDELIRVVTSKTASSELKRDVRNYLLATTRVTSAEVDEEIAKRLDLREEALREQGLLADAEEVERIRHDLSFPF